MPPLRDYICRDCGFQFEEFARYESEEPTGCSHCESDKIARLPSAVGGYHINGNNAGSTRPRSAGSFKRTVKLVLAILVFGLATNSVTVRADTKPSKHEVILSIAQAVSEVNDELMPEFSKHNRIHGLVPFRLMLAICTVESSLNPKAIHFHDGDGTSYGLCQIKEATARQIGFQSKTRVLMDMHVNAYYATKYFAHQMEKYSDDWMRAIAGYNRGSSGFHISNQEYVNRVLAEAVKE